MSTTRPTEAKVTEAKPTEAKPTEAKPTEAKPTEAKPTGSTAKISVKLVTTETPAEFVYNPKVSVTGGDAAMLAAASTAFEAVHAARPKPEDSKARHLIVNHSFEISGPTFKLTGIQDVLDLTKALGLDDVAGAASEDSKEEKTATDDESLINSIRKFTP